MAQKTVIVTAPINIALIKYWGKRDEFNIYPCNNSISLTLSQNQLMTTTKITTGSDLAKSSFSLNGIVQKSIPSRIKDVIIVCLLRARLAGRTTVYRHVCVESCNNFPTAAGLASSASGLAALAFGLAQLYELDGDLSDIARRGSGSSCRSMQGGIVHWIVSPSDESLVSLGCTSLANQLYPSSYWTELRVLICVTNTHAKPIGSTQGMQKTVLTSALFQHARRVSAVENESKLLAALAQRDFTALALVTMKESNQVHALCLDTWPPCVYLNESSFLLMRWVQKVNDHFGRIMVAYTFDAGPNCFLIAQAQDMSLLQHLLTASFGCTSPSNQDESDLLSVNINGSTCSLPVRGIRYPSFTSTIDSALLSALPRDEDAIAYVISTELGDGPTLVSSS